MMQHHETGGRSTPSIMSRKIPHNYFKRWRLSQGISAYKIAKTIGVHPSFISNIEANRRPMSEEFMQKLAAVQEFNLNYTTLRAWKLMAEYQLEEIAEAFKLQQDDR